MKEKERKKIYLKLMLFCLGVFLITMVSIFVAFPFFLYQTPKPVLIDFKTELLNKLKAGGFESTLEVSSLQTKIPNLKLDFLTLNRKNLERPLKIIVVEDHLESPVYFQWRDQERTITFFPVDEPEALKFAEKVYQISQELEPRYTQIVILKENSK
ncbi:MAG TPA: hypothetical protein PKY82_02365 [Pyrinomonadaceae bacterium]|nr:hypothetical protein [Pyrinomonadaceae bacterium]